MAKHKITKTFIDSIKKPKSGQVFYRDSELTGFAVRVTTTSKAFIVERKINGKTRRMTIGNYPVITVAQARSAALKIISEMVLTKSDPKLTKDDKLLKDITINQVFDDYCESKNLRFNTIRGYKTSLNLAFSDWREIPMADITREMVLKRHLEFSEHSERQANNHTRLLNALFNFAMVRYEYSDKRRVITDNPGRIVSESSAWNKETRRKTIIKPDQLPAWYKAVKKVGGAIPNRNDLYARVAYPLWLFTGLRRVELLSIKVEQINLKDRTITIPAELAKNNQELILPMSRQIKKILADWLDLSGIETGYIFPAKAGKLGYVQNLDYPKKEITENSGVKFMIHDLRRTFASISDSIGIPHITIKSLINHKTDKDVTEGYIIKDANELRESMQKISDKIEDYINVVA